MNYRLQNASRAFQANKWILCNKNVSIALRLKFFDAMVSSVVCFAAGHRKVYVGELRKLDAPCRKLLRRMVGPGQVRSACMPRWQPCVRAQATLYKKKHYLPVMKATNSDSKRCQVSVDVSLQSPSCFQRKKARTFSSQAIVGPPGINWNGPWHDILHEWHIRIEQQLECNGLKIWSHRHLTEYWKFANYVALLPEDRWIRRVLAWHPRQKRIGRTFIAWDWPLQHFGRWQHLED